MYRRTHTLMAWALALGLTTLGFAGCGDSGGSGGGGGGNGGGPTPDGGMMDTEMPGGDDGGMMDEDGGMTDTSTGPAPAVSVEDQWVTNRNEVTVPSVTSPQQGWLVIHVDDEGSPGQVIGQAQVEQGSNSDVTISGLSRKVEQGETLYAMLHEDTGTEGEYEFEGPDSSEDLPVTADGEVVVKPFTVRYPSVSVSDQRLADDTQVEVDEVRASGPGWIVIHKNDDGSPGAVIGQTQVEEGTNSDVTVELSEEASNQQTLYAMLHADTGNEGEYEFDGSDGSADPPVSVDDSVVVQSFEVTLPALSTRQQVVSDLQQVNVPEVVSGQKGWLVIHEDDGGSPGAVIGQTSVERGTFSNVSVSLDRKIENGETLYAMLHEDTGMEGEYEFDPSQQDSPDPPLTVGGDVVVKGFTVYRQSVSVSAQDLQDPSTVEVDRVRSAQKGWIVIHEEEGGSFGPVIGHAAVSEGTNAQVSVNLDRDATDSETLYAMLHSEAGGGSDMYDGVQTDPPVKVEGDIVVKSFTVTVP